MADLPISIDELRARIAYNPNSGKLTWLPREVESFTPTATRSAKRIANGFNAKHAGTEFGSLVGNGYRRGNIDKASLAAHRVAWALHYGEWPATQIDHINGDRSDNRIANLRLVDASENAKNQGVRGNNTSGHTGVVWGAACGKWLARITVNYRQINLGKFLTKAEAVAARKAAEIKHGFHPNHGRRAA